MKIEVFSKNIRENLKNIRKLKNFWQDYIFLKKKKLRNVILVKTHNDHLVAV